MSGSRATLRYPIDLSARLEVGGAELSARVCNLSLGGVLLIGPSLPIGTRCRLLVRTPHGEGFDAWCVTRWTTGEGCGLQFESLHAMDTIQLARIIGADRSRMRVIERRLRVAPL